MADLKLEIPGYHIKHELGRGGMAIVYLALQESLDRLVALKVIKPTLIADEEFARRFLREGRIIASLNHSHIVTVYDIAAHEGFYYLSMEYLPGATLKERIQAGLEQEQAADLIRALAGALSYAHERGVIHRDIKPQNILFRENGQPVLTDFGIAKTIGSSTIMTRTGLSLGTPRYMSPEQIRGQKTDARADLYSLGILFYEMLTGDVPYTAEDSFALAMMHVTAPIPPLPPELKRFQPVLDRLLEKDPDQRFQTAQEFLTALDHPESLPARPLDLAEITTAQAVSTGLAPASRPTQRTSQAALVGAVLAGMALAGSGYLYWSTPSSTPPPPPPAPSTVDTPPSPTLRQRADALLEQARQRQQAGDLIQSHTLAEQGLQLMPGHPELITLRTELEQQQKQLQAEQERQHQAETEAKQRAEAEAKQRAEAEAKQRAEAEAKQRAEAEQRRKAEQDQQQTEAEVRRRTQIEAKERQRAEAEQRRKAEQDRKRAEAEARRRARTEAKERQRAEAEQRRKAAEQDRQRAEAEARRRARTEAKERQQAEAEQRRQATQNRQRIEAEQRRQAEQDRQRVEAEAQRRARIEEQRRAEQEQQRTRLQRLLSEQDRQRTEGARQDRMRLEAEERQRQEDREWAARRRATGQ